MQYVLQNLPMICLFIAMLAAVICSSYYILTKPTDEKMTALREFLKWAVTMAERDLGSGTGQLKLRQVYGMALDKFPWLVRVISFDHFCELVDEALEWMREEINVNPIFNDLVKG